MESLTAVYVANLFGIVLLCILLMSNLGRLRENSTESNTLLLMMLFVFLGCAIDPLVCYSDGKEGFFNVFVVHAGNAMLYIADMFTTFFWFTFLMNHLKVEISPTHRYILQSCLMLGVAIIIVNFFMPLVFDVTENNEYTRQAGYWLYCAIDYGIMIDSIVMYLICRRKGGSMKSFPVWVYVAPVIIGTAVQSMFYGISVISASFTIATAGIIASLQSERIYKDKVSGAFNYAYLDSLEKHYSNNPKQEVSAIMINLNGFKKLNKDYGRSVANAALKNTSTIIAKSIGEFGSVVRFSSDEFIAFINTHDDMAKNMCIGNIRSRFGDFNKDPKNNYKLSACFSTGNLERGMTMDDFVELLSKRMHEEKMEFYSQGENNRRRG